MSNVSTAGSYIEIAEHRNYLELTNLVFFYNSASLNGLQLDYGETEEEQAASLEKAQSLCLMPVYAKCTVNKKGEPTFAGHEMVRKRNGEVVYKTEPIGVHESVSIENRDVVLADGSTVANLPCLIAKQRIWARNKNAVAAIRRLFNEGQLHNSFEMEVSQYTYDNGIRHATEYEFLGNAFLASDSVLHGSAVQPAYGKAAQVMEVASAEMVDCEAIIADALAQDLCEQIAAQTRIEVNETMNENEIVMNPEEEKITEVVETETVETAETEVSEEIHEETPAEEVEEVVPEASSLTERDIRAKIESVYNRYDYCGHIAFLFPEEHTAWMHRYDMMETEFDVVTYTVNGDEVTLSEATRATLVVSIRELNQKVEELSSANQKLTEEVASLTPYKEKVEQMEREEMQAKHDKEVAELRSIVKNSGVFSAEEIKGMEQQIAELKTLEIKAEIADRMMKKPVKAELSAVNIEKHTNVTPKSNLEEDSMSHADAVHRWLKKN